MPLAPLIYRSTSNQLAVRIANDMVELASISSPQELFEAQILIERVSEHLDNLRAMRHCALGFQDLFEQLPWLRSISLEATCVPTVEDGASFNLHELSVSAVTIEAALLDADEDTVAQQLEYAMCFQSSEPLLYGFNAPPIFKDELSILYSAMDTSGEGDGDAISQTVLREQVIDASDVDEMAERLFPEKWAVTAQALGLPYKGSAPRERPRA